MAKRRRPRRRRFRGTEPEHVAAATKYYERAGLYADEVSSDLKQMKSAGCAFVWDDLLRAHTTLAMATADVAWAGKSKSPDFIAQKKVGDATHLFEHFCLPKRK